MTTTDDPCIHELPPATCSICKPPDRTALSGSGGERPTETIPRWAAKREGQCSGCNLPIIEGALVTWAGSPGASAVVHGACR